jgi:hypothetical protein
METPKNRFLPALMNLGAIVGLALALNLIIQYFTGHMFSGIEDIFNYLIIIIGLSFTMRHFRDHTKNGYISYSEALWTGTRIGFFASVVFAFAAFILFKADSSLTDKFLDVYAKNLLDAGRSEELVEQQITFMRPLSTPILMFFSYVFGFTLLGFIFSLIIAIFVKKEQNPYDRAMSEIKDLDQE